MSDFAKLYQTNIGQVLVKIDSAESEAHEAEIRIYFQPDGLGVCSTAFSYNDWDLAESAFESIDEEKSVLIASTIIERFTK